MLVLGCKSCMTAVFYDTAHWSEGAPLMLNVIQIPCPKCGAPSMWDGFASNEDPTSVESMKLLAKEAGWLWQASSFSDGGIYRLDRSFIPYGGPVELNLRALQRYTENVGNSVPWWLSEIMKHSLEQGTPQR